MKKTIITTITLIILFIGAYALYVFYMNSQPIVCPDGQRMNPVKGECVDAGFSDDNSDMLDFEKIIFQVPQSSTKLTLEKNDTGLFTGTYTDAEFPSFKGFISLDPKEVTYFDDTIAIVPFFLNSGGTGQFMYVALIDRKTNSHLSSVFVEDRTTINSVEMSGDKILINYLTRSSSQSFSDFPKIPAQLVLTIKSDELVEFMRLENATFDQIELRSPTPQSTIKGDFLIRGAIPGYWYFEAIAGFKIIDQNLNELVSGQVEARSDWMTERKVPFEFLQNTGSFSYTGPATLIIESENVQGGEEGELKVKKMKIPVTID